jgi:hypothetical protein
MAFSSGRASPAWPGSSTQSHPFDTLGVPGATLIPAPTEHQVSAHCVGAVAVNQVVQGDDIAPAFGHLFAVFAQDDALVAQHGHRFIKIDHTQIAHDFGKEAGIDEMHRGVLDAAGVDIDWQPVGSFFWIDGH